MATETPLLKIKYIEEGQVRSEILFNESANIVDAVAQLVVKDIDPSPPVDPLNGKHYIVSSSGASGAWTGKENNLALYYDGWIFIPAAEGMKAYVTDEDCIWIFRNGAWVRGGPIASLTQTISGTYVQSEVNNIQSKVNEILTMLRDTGAIKT